MSTTITSTDGAALCVGNIFCVGHNYVAHIQELGAIERAHPMIFIKPTSALCLSGQDIHLPHFSHNVHYECELVLRLGSGGKNISADAALAHISHVGIGLDLTARDVQDVAKKNGLPWAISKGFDNAACLSPLLPISAAPDLQQLSFTLHLNGELRQRGHVPLMIFSPAAIIAYLSSIFTLQAGDLIYTGTPHGVGSIHAGNDLELDLGGLLQAHFHVAG